MTSKQRGAGFNIQTYVDPCTVASIAKLLASRGVGFNRTYSGLLKALMEDFLSQARMEQFQEFVDPESALEYLATSGFSMSQVSGWNEKRVLNKKDSKIVFLSENCHPQTIDVIKTRAEPLGLEIIVGDEDKEISDEIIFLNLLAPCSRTSFGLYLACWFLPQKPQ